MRWIVRIGLALVLAWVAYAASPFVAFYHLAEAVRARDVAALNERVDFRALRQSVARQLVADYLARKGGPGEDQQGLRRQAAVGVGATVIDPFIERFATAEALIRMLEDRPAREGSADETRGGLPSGEVPQLGQIDLTAVKTLWRLWVDSAPWGFRQITIYVASPKRPDERFGFRMRLGVRSLRWRLTGIELLASLRARLVNEIPRAG